MKPTLFLLAAGMGSRYGGLKQLDGLGPNGETIMDYSIYDAINAGFGKLVFVIRKDFEQDFREKIISKYEGHIPCELVFQALDNLPEGFTCPAQIFLFCPCGWRGQWPRRSASYRRGTAFSLSLPAAQFFPRFSRTSDAAIFLLR